MDRLKQIWGGFERTTTRRLTGRGVSNIVVPRREDALVDDEAFLSPEFLAPAEAAFRALRERLAASDKKTRREGRDDDPKAAPPLSEASLDGDSEAARDLIRGLKATEARVRRSDIDYEATLSGGARKKLFRKQAARAAARPKAPKLKIKGKKFLGIFGRG